MAERIISLETSTDSVRAAVAERSWNSFVLVGAFEARRALGESDLSAAIRRLIEQTGTPDIVISAFPGELVAKRLLTLPFRDRRKLEQAVPFALEEHLPFAVDDAVVAFVSVGREDGGERVLAAMARKADLSAHLELLTRAGLDPKTVTLSALTLAALLTGANSDTTSPHLLLDMEQERISLVMLAADGAVQAVRTIPCGPEAQNGNGNPEAAMAKVIAAVRQTMLAQGGEAEPPEVILTGELGMMPAVQKQVSAALALDVRGCDRVDLSGPLEGLTPEWMRFASCVSMLLGETPRAAAKLINLRRGEFAFRGRHSDLTTLRKPAMVAIAVFALALLHLALTTANQFRQLHFLERQIVISAGPALGAHPTPNVKAALISGVADMHKRLRMMGGSRGSPLEILLAISHSIPPRLSIDVNDMLIDEGGVKISGTADSFATVDQLKKALGSNDTLGDIQVTDAKVGTDTSKVEFRLSAAIRDNPMGAD